MMSDIIVFSLAIIAFIISFLYFYYKHRAKVKRKDNVKKMRDKINIENPKEAFYYAMALGERFLEAEPFIMKSPQYACYYATEFMNGVWSEAEEYIMKDAGWAAYYSANIPKEYIGVSIRF